MGSGVLRMTTAHWTKVVGGFFTGTKGSGSFGVVKEMERWERSTGGGGGSANSAPEVDQDSPQDR